MKISSRDADYDSRREFIGQISRLSDAGAPVIHVRSVEPYRALGILRESLVLADHEYNEWDVVNGWIDYDLDNYDSMDLTGDERIDVNEAIAYPRDVLVNNKGEANVDGKEGRKAKDRYFVYSNVQFYLSDNPVMNHFLQYYNVHLPGTRFKLILVTDDSPVPEHMASLVAEVRLPPMGHRERLESINMILDSVDMGKSKVKASDLDRISYSGAGMPTTMFDLAVSMGTIESLSKHKKLDVDTMVSNVNKGKVEVINKSDVLELMTIEQMDHVGGMENIKKWISMRNNCYSDEAAQFGVQPPKGIVYVGIPGTGKSLLGKAVAGALGIPLVKMDVGRLFNSLLGQTEERTRRSLDIVSDIAPVVLLIDEIDKGLGGVASGSTSSDGGASSRVLGTILTWLQDSDKPVFTICTANNLDGLPPELLRKGRFDAIFYSGPPSPRERRDIFSIHLRKRNRKLEDFSEKEIETLLSASNQFTGADIEQCIKDSIVDAFSNGEELSVKHILGQIKSTKTLYASHEKAIVTMLAKAQQLGIPAGDYGSEDVSSEPSRRIKRKRSVTVPGGSRNDH